MQSEDTQSLTTVATNIAEESERRLRAIFDDAPIGMAIGPLEQGTILQVNRAFADMLGYSLEECQALTIAQISHPDDMALNTRLRDELLRGERDSYTLEKRYLRKDGEQIWARVSASAVRDADGSPLYVIAQVQDITASRAAEAEIVRSKERFRSLVEHSSDWVWEVDSQGRYTYSSPVVRDLLGYEPDEIIGRTPFELMPPEEAARVTDAFLSIIAVKGEIRGLENVNLHKDGHEVVLETSGVPMLAKDGELLGYRGMDRDITARKSVERLLEESERRYRILVESAPDAIFVAEVSTGKLVDANPQASELIGRPLDEIVGMDQWELHPPEERENYARIFRENSAKGIAVAPDLLAVAADGRRIPVEISSSVFEFRGRTLVQGVFRDITRRNRYKQLSDALNEANQEINSTLDIDEILEQVVVRAAKAMGCDTAAINMRDGDTWMIRYHYGMESNQLGDSLTDAQAKSAMSALLSGQVVIVNNTLADDRVDREIIEKYRIKSLMTVPLIVHGESLGVLYFQNQTEGRVFTDADEDFARKLAASVALAIQNARVYAGQAHIAETLQASLLTVPKKVRGLHFGHLYRAASAEAKVGGDFYDLFELPGGLCGVIVGDVSGKGLQAATLTMLIKDSLKAYLFQGDEPHIATKKTGLILQQATGSTMFVTTFVAVIDPSAGVVSYCSAGHPPALLKRARRMGDSGSAMIEVIRGGGPLLGAFSTAEYSTYKAGMCTGDTLLAYTDGVTEARLGGELFGQGMLQEFLATAPDSEAEHLPQAVLDEVVRFSGGNLKDDCAIVAVQLV